MSAQNQIVQKKVVRLQPEYRRKRQFYNMLLEIVPKKMMSREKFDEYSPDDIQFFVEQEIEKMSDEESKSCYQVEFGKIVDDECGDEVYNKKPVFKFVAEACGCEFFPEEAEEIEFECDRNNDNAYCPECYDGEYDEECANCDCLCSSEYKGEIDGEEEPICEDCFDRMDRCEGCNYPTDADEKNGILYCKDCEPKPKPSQMFQSILAEAVIKQEALKSAEFKCDNCDEVSCGEVKFFPDDKEKKKKICCLCFDEEEVWFYKCVACNVEADQRNLPKCEDAEYCCECCWKQEGGKNSCECYICVANPKPKEPEPDEEFKYGGVRNDTLCNIFGGEVVFNKLKALAQAPDDEKDMRVVWKFGEEHLSLYVYLDGEPFLDAVYPRNHSCDMFYHLQELKEFVEQECEVNGVCWECGIEGKFIGKEGDDWRCSECSSI